MRAGARQVLGDFRHHDRAGRSLPPRSHRTRRLRSAQEPGTPAELVIHLDTSYLVDLLREGRRGKPGAATATLESLADEELAVSLFVLCALEAAAADSDRPEQERARILGLLAPLELVLPGPSMASICGRVRSELERRGETIATMDLLIAATALADSAPLDTGNRRHFERIADLEVISY